MVSIPHRLATNSLTIAENWEVLPEFQFLIGWLQTLVHTYNDFLNNWFQFLIGWLQTGRISQKTLDMNF